ncbi:MAG: DUF4215 domain-containing protein [Myxococcota bacterium]|nr:DUF4215 domain-containing protein [Myxococcota bacterium]
MRPLSTLALLGALGCSGEVLPLLPDGAPARDVCGNNVVEGSEACDDGNRNDNDGCLNTCRLATCGDGVVRVDVDSQSEGFEACDDGNALNTDGCLATCRLPGCGDGYLRNDLEPSDPAFEQCDDGNSDPSDGCHRCRVGCGNGVVEAGEACDDGNDVETDGCTNTCAAALCGDGIRRADVEADDPAYEECDDGNSVDTDGCTRTCRNPSCGDGFINGEEACDDGNDDNTDACTNDCAIARCGDGHRRLDVGGGREGFEECDDGNEDDSDDCVGGCRLRRCGDGFVATLHEGCDDGNEDEDDGCLSSCRLATCGDGVIDEGELCDDGNEVDTDACTGWCLPARCGDGLVRQDLTEDHPRFEACDDGNAVEADGCLNTCRLATCGDGVVRRDLARRVPGFEDCDPADPLTAEGCIDCRRGCGDGVVDAQAGEVCDDGDDDDADGCRNDCQVAVCGDGVARLDVLEGHPEYEACDDGNTETGDGCRGDCSLIEVTDVWAGVNITCAAFGDGSARCWGSGDADLKNWVAGQRSVRRAIVLNFAVACVLRVNEQIDCYNRYQAQPSELTLSHSQGQPIREFIDVDGSSEVFCALARSGRVYCQKPGLMFRGPGWWVVTPVATNSLYLAIDTNTNGACGLTRNDRSVECWGYRDTTYQRRHGPIANSLGVSAFSVSIGGLVMVDAMGVRGRAHQGSLPLSRQSCDRAPMDYNAWGDVSPWQALSRSEQGTCGITEAGEVYCVGSRAGFPWEGSGPCINEGRYLPQPIALPDNERAVQLTAGARHYCVRTDQGMMYCWGYNNVGQIGLGGGEAVSPIRVAP